MKFRTVEVPWKEVPVPPEMKEIVAAMMRPPETGAIDRALEELISRDEAPAARQAPTPQPSLPATDQSPSGDSEG